MQDIYYFLISNISIMLRTDFCACMVFYVIVYFLTAVDCDGRSLNCLTQSKACAYGMTCV